jgi:hypothetical protein
MVGGCAAPAPAVENAPQASRLTVDADWDDVEAAARVAASQAELAILEVEKQDQVITIRLRTIAGEPGEVRAERNGLFREPASERRLLQAMAKRLRQLAGVDVAPL